MRRLYKVDSRESRVVATARSSVHDTEAVFSGLSGTIEADPDGELTEPDAVTLAIAVDMTTGDAGDFLRTRKLRGDIDVERYPEARFSLARVATFERGERGAFEASGEGTLAWRDREVTLAPTGRGTLDEEHIAATATFSFDMRELGVKPPKFLMLKVEPEVEVTVTLVAYPDVPT